MDNVLLIQNIFDAFIFVLSSIIFALLYGGLDKKYHFTKEIFSVFNGIYKWEWIIHIILALILIAIIHYLGTYVFTIPNLLINVLIGLVAGICMYNSNRHNIL